MTLIEAAKQALEALEYDTRPATEYGINTAITILKQAIAEAEQQEPVAWLYVEPDNPYQNVHCGDVDLSQFPHDEWFPVYKAQPKREWQGLTLEQKHQLNDALNLQGRFPIIEAIEAAIKENNT